jgi:hypothetical protein
MVNDLGNYVTRFKKGMNTGGWGTILTIEAVRTSETSVNFYHTAQRSIREDSRLHTFMFVAS